MRYRFGELHLYLHIASLQSGGSSRAKRSRPNKESDRIAPVLRQCRFRQMKEEGVGVLLDRSSAMENEGRREWKTPCDSRNLAGKAPGRRVPRNPACGHFSARKLERPHPRSTQAHRSRDPASAVHQRLAESTYQVMFRS